MKNIEDIKPLKLSSSEQGIWFTSDLHFNHHNIIRFCNRPWSNVGDMDEALISNWNSVVKDDDIVFNLGDFAFAPSSKWKEYLSRLNGRHILILGNHEITRWPGDKIISLFERVEQQLLLKIDGRYVYLNHYPYLCFAGAYRDLNNGAVFNLFGHVHSGPNVEGKDKDRLRFLFPYQYDVGIDNNDYHPVSWKQVCGKIEEQVKNYVDLVEYSKNPTIPDEAYKQ